MIRRFGALRAVTQLAFAISFSGLAFAQGLGTIVGTVTDKTGAVMPAAKVKITDAATSTVRETSTNDQGYYVVPALRPSTYMLTVEATGFAPSVRKGILLQADESITVNETVSVEQSNQTIEVSGEASQVNTTTSTVSEVVDQRRVVELPLNGRNAASLLLVVAGATPAPGTDVDQGNTKTFPATVTVSTNGSRQNQVSFRLDGANNNDLYTNANQPFPFPDALQEFSVQTANYSAKYGGNAGGVVNVVTRSGANDFHGNAFEFVRNAVFNARNFFAANRDQLKRNQFGGTVSGPIDIPRLYNGKNRDFFFFGYQGTRIRNLGGTTSAFVPTAANATGDFSNVLSGSNPANPFGKDTTVVDPVTGLAFPGNKIPTSRLDPAAVAFLKYLPVASSGNGRIFYAVPLAQDFNEFVTRVDHSFSDRDRLTGRYFFDRFRNTGFLDKSNYLSNSNFSVIDSQNVMLGETHVLTPTALNEVRLSFSRETSNRGPAPGSISLASLGVNIYQPPVNTIEGINVSGFFNPSQTDPAAFIRNQYNISDDFNWVLGKHSLSFGVTGIHAQVLLRNQFRTSGSYSFTADVTNDALVSFMLGYVRTFTQGFGEFKDNLVNTWSGYVQDDFHVSRRLTLNLGLRYDPMFPWQERMNRVEQFSVSNYNANVRSQVYTNAPAGLLFPGDPGVPKWGASGSYNNFSPRVGFAYDLTGDGKTSLRGGGGIFYDAIQDGIFNNRFVDVTPFSPQFSLTQPQGSFSNPLLGLVNPYPSPFPPPKNSPFPGPVLVITYDPANGGKELTPVVYQWNMIVERQFRADWVARVAYVGSQSRHLLESTELNPSVYIPGSKLSTDARRAFQPYGSISQASQDINSGYNSLQLTLQKRYSHGLTILGNYTWSKSIDTLPYNQGITGVSAGSNSPIPWNFPGRHQYDRGPSEFDHTQRFVVSYVYDLPKFGAANRLVRTALGGWQFTGILTYQTGGPLTILAGKDQSQTGIGSDRANYLGGSAYGSGACGSSGPCVNYLVPSAFGLPAIGTFGNVGKGSLRGPDLFNWDTGLFKEFPIRERMRLQFRAEFFNTLNRKNFNNPNVTQSAGGFGSITSAQDPRIGQLALKLQF
ncbi:MAG: TonB-dependent receptor, plug [Bryobacterales bacterium]|nr:TonB-dependent receptor, plug [Bryobacterales bacterium]